MKDALRPVRFLRYNSLRIVWEDRKHEQSARIMNRKASSLKHSTGGNHDSIWNVESLCREQLYNISGRIVDRHGRFDVLSKSITSSNRSQKTWKVSWRFYRSDMVVVCDNVLGCTYHLRACAVSAGGSFHWTGEPNHSRYSALRIGCLFRYSVHGKT